MWYVNTNLVDKTFNEDSNGFILTMLFHILCLHKPNENTDIRKNKLSTSDLSLIIIHLETEGISFIICQ